MKNKFTLLILIIILGITMAGCDQEASLDSDSQEDNELVSNDSDLQYDVKINKDSVSIIDGLDQEITIEKNLERVVIIYNSYLDIWMRNGGNVVGKLEDTVGQESAPNTEDVQVIGKLGGISLEKLLSVEPELVILNSALPSQMELVTPLEENGIQVLAIDYKGKEDYFKLTRLFSALNESEDLFEENVIAVEKGINEIISKAPEDEEIKVLVLVASAREIRVRDSKDYVGLMLDDLNTINIADTSGDLLDDKNFSLEKILQEDPDYIFLQTSGSDMESIRDRIFQDMESSPAWSSLTAVENDRYIILPKDLYMTKANHRYVEAYEGLAKIIYPDVFE